MRVLVSRSYTPLSFTHHPIISIIVINITTITGTRLPRARLDKTDAPAEKKRRRALDMRACVSQKGRSTTSSCGTRHRSKCVQPVSATPTPPNGSRRPIHSPLGRTPERRDKPKTTKDTSASERRRCTHKRWRERPPPQRAQRARKQARPSGVPTSGQLGVADATCRTPEDTSASGPNAPCSVGRCAGW